METIQNQAERLALLEGAVFYDTLKAGTIVLATLVAKDLIGKTPQDAYRSYFLSTLGASATFYQLSKLNQKVSKMKQVGEWMALYGVIDPSDPDGSIEKLQGLPPERWKGTLWLQKTVEQDPLKEEVAREFIARKGETFEKHANWIVEVKGQLKGGHKALLTGIIMGFREHRKALCHLIKWPYSNLAYEDLKRCEEAIRKQLKEVAKAPPTSGFVSASTQNPPPQDLPVSTPLSEETNVSMPPPPQDQVPPKKEPSFLERFWNWWNPGKDPILPL